MSELCWTPNLDHGNDITNYPLVHFCAEFLSFPTSEWEVDWLGRMAAIIGHPMFSTKGAKVKHLGTGRIWVLTGEYDWKRDSYVAAWPD